jgi:hypothetical protein
MKHEIHKVVQEFLDFMNSVVDSYPTTELHGFWIASMPINPRTIAG